MNIFKKILNKFIIWCTVKRGYARLLDNMCRIYIGSLNKKWDIQKYKQLDDVRIVAESDGLWFEEMRILIQEISLLIKQQADKQLFYVANARLIKLSEILDLDDEEFAEKFQEKYKSSVYQYNLKLLDSILKEFFDYFYERADFMACHLQYNIAILCSKAASKIAKFSDVVSFEEYAEVLIQLAVNYGKLGKWSKVIDCYNEVLHLAQESKDLTYEYISIVRKLYICIVTIDISVHIDKDQDRIDGFQELLTLCNKYNLNIYELGVKLLSEESIESRKNRIREVIPFLGAILAFERGDWKTALHNTEELNIAMSKAYGEVEYNDAEMIEFSYKLFNNSAARELVDSTIKDKDIDIEEDLPYQIQFPDNTYPFSKLITLQLYAKAEIAREHPICAIALADAAMQIADNMFSDYHRLESLFLIGQAREKSGNISKAIEVYKTIVNEYKKEYHPGSNIVFSKHLMFICLVNIGYLQKETEPKEAIKVFNEAFELMDKSSYIDIVRIKLNAIIDRAIAYKNIGDRCMAEKDLICAIEMVIAQTSKRLKYMDGDLRENYWNEVNKIIQKIVGLCDGDDSDDLRNKMYELLLFSKGFLLSSENALKAAIFSENVPEDIRRIYEELEKYEQERNPWGTMTEDSSNEYVNHYMQRMRLMCATHSIIDKYSDFANQDYTSIIDSLGQYDIVIDFYDYEIENDDRQYVAFVNGIGYKAPLLFKAFKESDIQRIFNEVSTLSYNDGKPFSFTEAYNPEYGFSNKIYNCILGQIIEKLSINASFNVYIVPSGSLHKIPIESLAVNKDSALIASDYFKSVVRLSHFRTIKNILSHSSFDSICLYGGLDYGCEDDTTSKNRGYKLYYENRDVTLLEPWKNLPYSQIEVDYISFIWSTAKNKQIRKYTQTNGTAETVYGLNGDNISVIHFATHGFFETRESAINLPVLKGRFSAMDLSGIVMSNGNRGWLYGSSTQHEGIITASDIAKMDLSNTSLVVLSVCDSGNGTVRYDELYGLQRAFKKAGVKSIVMSLWSELDESGAIFMKKFYLHLLVDNLSLIDSFNRAKNEVREQLPHPAFWANFVLID